ncbi:MAG TPA: flagellar biosynthesis anti-sigma factor FlgM [Acidobacteriaceae bacterium]|nr:flagellar biosynthesis anti-sigma factor FlgM [Acidobacteriaceae bacterium]
MRIDLTNSAAGQIASEVSAKAAGAQGASAADSHEDRTTLTSGAGSVESLVSQAMSSPEVRADKVASLKEAIGNGSYQLDPAGIAASMIDEHA